MLTVVVAGVGDAGRPLAEGAAVLLVAHARVGSASVSLVRDAVGVAVARVTQTRLRLLAVFTCGQKKTDGSQKFSK